MDIHATSKIPTWVYIIQAKSGAIKIGIAVDTRQRLATHQVSNHEQLTLIYSFECQSIEQATKIEQALHTRYHAQNIHGEWFAVEPQNIIHDIEFFSALCEAITSIKVEYIPIVSKPSKAPPTKRVNLREIAQQVHDNGDQQLTTEQMMQKYYISKGGTSKVRELLTTNGFGNHG